MERILEPEIMEGVEQARVYAEADFSKENQWFVDHFLKTYPDLTEGTVLDLGCGPADIPIRLTQAKPTLCVIGVDASAAMLQLAKEVVERNGLSGKVTLIHECIQNLEGVEPASAIISNSLAHHIPNPIQFWYTVKRLARPGAPVLVMDLLRPESVEEAEAIVNMYAAEEPEQLRKDFFLSLRSAFTEDEVAAQLAELNLSRLLIDVPDDRHWIVYGRV